jgi:hypothetical protein
MSELNVVVSVGGIVLSILISGMTYYNVVDSNNNKEIVTRAIERGNDPVSAACAANINTGNGQVRSTCEKLAIIKGK